MKFITGNTQKFSDAQAVLRKAGIKLSQVEIDLPEIQAASSGQVSMSKAIYASSRVDGPFFVEDSSFHIHALNGFPGVYTKYVLSTINCNGILKLMQNIDNRECNFESNITTELSPRIF